MTKFCHKIHLTAIIILRLVVLREEFFTSNRWAQFFTVFVPVTMALSCRTLIMTALRVQPTTMSKNALPTNQNKKHTGHN